MKESSKSPKFSQVSVVVPIYNEIELLGVNIPDFIKYVQKNYSDSEVVLVENGSDDGSAQAVDGLAKLFKIVRVVHLPKPFYGAAMRAGMLEVSKPKVVKLDADWLNIQFMEAALPLLEDFAIVSGSKDLRPDLDKRPFVRKAGSKLLTYVLNHFFGYSGGDSRGLKAFRRQEMLELLNESVSDEIIESEMMLRAFRAGIPATEIPVAIEEIRPPRISFAKRCLIVARELIKLYQAVRSTKSVVKRGLHADDAGLSPEVNNTIQDLLKKGRLQSVSLMVNSPHSAQAAKILAKYPQVEVFFHFNLTSGQPVAAPQDIPSLVNKQGQFAAVRQKFVLHCVAGKVKKDDVVNEFKAQWQRLTELGINVQGIDSEQHAHSLEPAASVVADFAHKNHIKTIRNFGQMRTVTLSGGFRLKLLKLAARLTSLRYNRTLVLPPSWRGRTWKSFAMASWEPINLRKVTPDTILAIHPKAGFDETITPEIEL